MWGMLCIVCVLMIMMLLLLQDCQSHLNFIKTNSFYINHRWPDNKWTTKYYHLQNILDWWRICLAKSAGHIPWHIVSIPNKIFYLNCNFGRFDRFLVKPPAWNHFFKKWLICKRNQQLKPDFLMKTSTIIMLLWLDF